MGSKQWWGLVKDYQGELSDTTIPPLISENDSTASTTLDKVNMLAQHFSKKLTVPHPNKLLTSLLVVAGVLLTDLTITEADVRVALSAPVETKAVGSDGISHRLLRRCSNELARPLTSIFEAILRHN